MSAKAEAARPLRPEQALAAERLGLGWEAKRVAAEAGVTPKAIQRWRKRNDFRELAETSRRRVLEENPTPTAVLASAMSATKRDGSPDWQMRVTAARALLGSAPLGETSEEKVRETQIFLAPPNGGER